MLIIFNYVDYLLIILSGASHGCFGTPCIGASPLEVENNGNNGNNGNNHHTLCFCPDDFTISFSLRRAHLDAILCKSRLSNSCCILDKNMVCGCLWFGLVDPCWSILDQPFWSSSLQVTYSLPASFNPFRSIQIHSDPFRSIQQERGHRCKRSTSRWSLSPVRWYWWVGLSNARLHGRKVKIKWVPAKICPWLTFNLAEFQIPKDWELRQTTTLHSGDTGLDVSWPWLRWDVTIVYTLGFNRKVVQRFPVFSNSGWILHISDASQPSLRRSTSVLLDKMCLWPSFHWQNRQWALSCARPEPKQTGLNRLNQAISIYIYIVNYLYIANHIISLEWP